MMSSQSTNQQAAEGGERLQKVLAGAGLGSRRACENLIAAGRVAVNGEIVSRMGARVDPIHDVIHVDGERLVLDESLVYLAMHKPAGVLSAMSDDRGRPTVGDYVRKMGLTQAGRVFHVGRLDADSEGLLLLTNDGTLAHRLTHPSYDVPKTYRCQVPGPVTPAVGKKLRTGVELDDGLAMVDRFRVVDSVGNRAMVELVIHEGRKRIVRRILAAVGHPVQRLIRVQIGPVRLGQLSPGTIRPLSRSEVGQLYKLVGL